MNLLIYSNTLRHWLYWLIHAWVYFRGRMHCLSVSYTPDIPPIHLNPYTSFESAFKFIWGLFVVIVIGFFSFFFGLSLVLQCSLYFLSFSISSFHSWSSFRSSTYFSFLSPSFSLVYISQKKKRIRLTISRTKTAQLSQFELRSAQQTEWRREKEILNKNEAEGDLKKKKTRERGEKGEPEWLCSTREATQFF